MKSMAELKSSWMRTIAGELRSSLVSTIALALLLCGIYPVLVWALAQGLFPYQANGSLVTRQGRVIGSTLIAQKFAGPMFFHPRPSAAGDGYDATRSGGSNLGPLSRKLAEEARERSTAYRLENGLSPDTPIPADAVTASGSGLDPHISVRNALLQARRVASSRNLREETIMEKIKVHTEGRDFGIFGEPRVNVLQLNLDLDGKP